MAQHAAAHRSAATKRELRQLRYLKVGTWLRLAPETRKVVEGVRNIKEEALSIPELDGCLQIAERLRSGETFPELILAHVGDDSHPYVIIEGNSRATAYVAFPEVVAEDVPVFVGTCGKFPSWRFY